MRRRTRIVRRQRVVILSLFVLALGALLLPRAWTGRLISLVQVLVPFQHAATVATDAIAGALDGADPPDGAQAREREKLALAHRVASLELRVVQLEEENSLLTASRLFEVDGSRLGARGRLIPARALTRDLLSWRTSRLIDAGSLQGVRPGSAVASSFFVVDWGQSSGVQSGMAVLRGEVLVGLVDEQVGPHIARVKLLSDVSVEMRVRIGRLTDETSKPRNPGAPGSKPDHLDVSTFRSSFWLTGRGGGVMQISGVDRRLVQEQVIQVGDIVLSDPAGAAFGQVPPVPVAMVIGRLVSIEPDRENPLLSILTAKSAVDEAELERVWVYDPDVAD